MLKLPLSLKRVVEEKPILEHFVRGLPNLGEPKSGGPYCPEVAKIYDAFELYGNELYELENERIELDITVEEFENKIQTLLKGN